MRGRNASPDELTAAEKAKLEEGSQKAKVFTFNNNIYSNYNPDYIIETVSPAKRLLPKIDQKRVEMIRKLQLSGKIKSTGRSPVPLQLYEEEQPVDHLYITKVTKRVPVAHDQQL